MTNISKITKKVSRKRQSGKSLHEKSRDARRLRKASSRVEKLAKQSVLRAKGNERHCMYHQAFIDGGGSLNAVDRVAFFQDAAKVTTDVLEVDDLQQLIAR